MGSRGNGHYEVNGRVLSSEMPHGSKPHKGVDQVYPQAEQHARDAVGPRRKRQTPRARPGVQPGSIHQQGQPQQQLFSYGPQHQHQQLLYHSAQFQGAPRGPLVRAAAPSVLGPIAYFVPCPDVDQAGLNPLRKGQTIETRPTPSTTTDAMGVYHYQGLDGLQESRASLVQGQSHDHTIDTGAPGIFSFRPQEIMQGPIVHPPSSITINAPNGFRDLAQNMEMGPEHFPTDAHVENQFAQPRPVPSRRKAVVYQIPQRGGHISRPSHQTVELPGGSTRQTQPWTPPITPTEAEEDSRNSPARGSSTSKAQPELLHNAAQSDVPVERAVAVPRSGLRLCTPSTGEEADELATATSASDAGLKRTAAEALLSIGGRVRRARSSQDNDILMVENTVNEAVALDDLRGVPTDNAATDNVQEHAEKEDSSGQESNQTPSAQSRTSPLEETAMTPPATPVPRRSARIVRKAAPKTSRRKTTKQRVPFAREPTVEADTIVVRKSIEGSSSTRESATSTAHSTNVVRHAPIVKSTGLGWISRRRYAPSRASGLVNIDLGDDESEDELSGPVTQRAPTASALAPYTPRPTASPSATPVAQRPAHNGASSGHVRQGHFFTVKGMRKLLQERAVASPAEAIRMVADAQFEWEYGTKGMATLDRFEDGWDYMKRLAHAEEKAEAGKEG